MTATLIWSTTLVKVDCCNCGVIFGVPKDLDEANRDGGPKRLFWCPNGHQQHYVKSTEQILQEKLDQERRWRRSADTALQAARDQAEAAERSAAAYKGVATKLKKRAAAGVCPCCTRSFANLRAHMTSQHPGFADDETAESAGPAESGARVACDRCGREVLLRSDGKMRAHRRAGVKRACSGSREFPVKPGG